MLRTLEETYGRSFESSILRLLLFDRQLSESLMGAVDPGLFISAINREIISTLQRLQSQSNGRMPSYKPVLADLTERIGKLAARSPQRASTLRKAKTKITRIGRLPEPSVADVAYIQDNLRKFITHRNTETALLECVELVEAGEYDRVREVIEEATQSGRMSLGGADIGLEFTDASARLDEYRKKVGTCVVSGMGIPALDGLMRGGLEPGNLGVITARPGVGKTMGLISLGTCALVAGLNVVHVTCEIPTTETAIRYESRLLGYPINNIRKNIDRYEKKIRRAAQRLQARCFIREWGPSEASVADIRAYLKMLEIRKEGFRPDVVLVDYADLLTPTKKRSDELLEISDTYKGLRQIARDYACRVWTASQVNKDGYDKEVISLRDLYGTHEKSAIPDIVIAFCVGKDEQRKKRMRIALLKNRQGGGEGQIVECIVNTATQTITESPLQRSRLRRGGYD